MCLEVTFVFTVLSAMLGDVHMLSGLCSVALVITH